MKKYLKMHWFESVFALVMVAAIAVVVTVKFGYVYSTNDDVMMKNIINGNFTGTVDGHLVFISYVLSSFWKFLYNILPGVSWYDVFMVGVHYLCWFLIIVRLGGCAAKKKLKTIIMLLVTMLLIVIDLKYLVIVQFTVVSAELAAVSVLWVLTGKRDTKIEWAIDYTVILSTLYAASQFRKEPFLVALPVALLAIMLDVWKRSGNKKELYSTLKKTAICIGIFCLVYGVDASIEKAAYSSSEWSDFSRSQEARPQVYDYSVIPSFGAYESAYKALGLDYADWMAIYTYNCELAEDFDVDVMEGVAEVVKDSENSWRAVSNKTDIFKKNFYQLCFIIFGNEIQPIGLILAVFYIVALLLCYKRNDKKTGIVLLMMLGFYLAAFFYLIDRGRMPERVLYGMHFMQLMCLLSVVLDSAQQIYENRKKDKFWSAIIIGFCGMAFFFSFVYTWQVIKAERNELLQKAADWEYVNDYFESYPENRYCLDTLSFVFSTEELFSDKIESDNIVRMGGWTLNSLLQKQRMEMQGVENLLHQLVEDKQFYIVQEAGKDTAWIDIIYEEKGYDVEAVVVEEISTPGGRTFEIIQMQ